MLDNIPNMIEPPFFHFLVVYCYFMRQNAKMSFILSFFHAYDKVTKMRKDGSFWLFTR